MEELNLSYIMDDNQSFIDRIIETSGTDIRQCYQCTKCSGDCPGAFAMDYLPNQIIRMLMLGMKEDVLRSKTIWVCMVCNACTTRCIRDIDVARVMDALRREAIRDGYTEHAGQVVACNDAFLWTVYSWGRLFDAGMLLMNNLKSANYMKDMQFALPMILKGKSPMIPIPRKIMGVAEVRKIFEKTRQEGI
jgi:heterodisulfide reductase subunit C